MGDWRAKVIDKGLLQITNTQKQVIHSQQIDSVIDLLFIQTT
jgi:hypothetical protein